MIYFSGINYNIFILFSSTKRENRDPNCLQLKSLFLSAGSCGMLLSGGNLARIARIIQSQLPAGQLRILFQLPALMFIPEIDKVPQLVGFPMPPLLCRYGGTQLLRVIGANIPTMS
jgi:hypothetical protein